MCNTFYIFNSETVLIERYCVNEPCFTIQLKYMVLIHGGTNTISVPKVQF